jgi:23S rRNA-/tRNA-specific pseudouridylate synthase
LAVVEGVPREKEWTCELPIAPDPPKFGRTRVESQPRRAKMPRRTFRGADRATERFALIEASPLTGADGIRSACILAESGSPIMCDESYGHVEKGFRLGLRAVWLACGSTFTPAPREHHRPGWKLFWQNSPLKLRNDPNGYALLVCAW